MLQAAHAGEPQGPRHQGQHRHRDDQSVNVGINHTPVYRRRAKNEGKLAKLGDLNWRPYVATIRKYEGGDPPLDREMITPIDLSKAPQLQKVFDNGMVEQP